MAFVLWGRGLGFKADDLIRLATEDPLTGLLNARGFRRRLDEELAQAARAGESLSLMLIDLDGLKAINDTAMRREIARSAALATAFGAQFA